MTALQPYPAYKDSGVEWLGKVPEHWEVRRASDRLRVTKRPIDPREIPDNEILHYSIPNVQQHGGGETELASSLDSGKILVDRELLLVSKLNPRKGTIALATPHSALVTISSSEFVAMEPRGCLGTFARYFYASEHVRLELSSRVDSATKSHQRCTPADIAKLQVPWPPTEEQTAIARFLDHADRRIQRYIRAKERLIELLEEQKQAIIHQAVTGQIDVRTGQPYPAYKDSGVEWLGDVPEHWEVRRVKGATRILRGKFTHRPRNDPSLYGGRFPFVQTGDVARASKKIESYSQTLNEQGLAVSRKFPSGTLVMAIAANIGDVAVLDFEACFPDSVVGFVPNEGVARRDYLYCVFQAMKRELIREAPVNTQGNLNVDRLGSRRIPLPPCNEQDLIDRYIGETTGNLNSLVDQIRRQIELLKECCTRLIADVVTGKLDVREAAASLPEVGSHDSDCSRRESHANTSVSSQAADSASHPPHP